MFRLKRIYDRPADTDGVRILVDRLWPRGVTKEEARVDVWMKDVAPSAGLRKWFGHDVDKWDAFAQRYVAELTDNPGVQELRGMGRAKTVTLLYASYDDEHNNAVVLKDYLRGRTGVAGKFARGNTAQLRGRPGRSTRPRVRTARRATPSPDANRRTKRKEKPQPLASR